MRKLLILLAFLMVCPFMSCKSHRVIPYETPKHNIIRKIIPYKKRNMSIEEINRKFDRKNTK
jgi:hypothetical protein